MSAFPNSPRPIKSGIVFVSRFRCDVENRPVKSRHAHAHVAAAGCQGKLATISTRYPADKGFSRDEAMIKAARETKTGEWARAAGFNNVNITKAESSPGAYTNVEVEFTK